MAFFTLFTAASSLSGHHLQAAHHLCTQVAVQFEFRAGAFQRQGPIWATCRWEMC